MSSKKVIKNSIIYTFCGFLLKAFNFLLLPLYTSYLTTKDYGITNLISSFNSVMGVILVFSLYSAITRFYADYKYDTNKVKRLYGTIITFTLISGTIFFCVFIILKPLVMRYLFKGMDFYPTVLLALIGLIFVCLQTIYQFILQAMELAHKYTVRSIIYFFVLLGFNILFVVVLKWGANGVLLATLLANIIFTVYMFIDLNNNSIITICIDKEILKKTLKYSIPIIPHNLSTTIASLVSNVFIGDKFSLSSVGVFGLATQFGNITDTIQASVNNAFTPWFYDVLNNKDKKSKKEIIKLTNILLWFYGVLFLGIALFSQDLIILFLNKSYWKAWTVVPFMIVSFSIKTIYYFYINILFYYKEATKYIFISTLSSSICNIILSAIFIPKMDIYGSALADIISMFLRVTIVVILSKRYENIGYKISLFIKSIFLNFIFISLGLIFSYSKYIYEFSFLNFSYKFSIFIIYVGIAIFSQRNYLKLLIDRFCAKKIDILK
ncbi:lipopolysaccharide biosynthesis protein [Clostridium perfringens]|uniref:lipopolysaccharide biosynthesis protein n=1 Tax=Clostridium perfringens TaxID=1502 RepID=UPI0001666181|nr:oligosaccharide flippase family protein [Clostridium perfringens]AXH51541.1 sugar lyase [Clostridium perfringens]EDS81043.1 putative polysaccharide transporter protein [Clostridium perfringens C str. JGS1495]MBI6030581.1 oligosaccharide flippase family protein [Clostridium perfringens]MBI6033843.1 oligosaccharide flippase family protein [Clostridium perfringens]NGT46717.1 oligosaccharide flippase family protein [Clostridium perfringens]